MYEYPNIHIRTFHKHLSLIFGFAFPVSTLRKQHPRCVLRKRCSKNIQQIYRRTSMPKCDVNKVAKQLY